MKIRGEQLALINSLRCERLSSNEENFRLIDSFYSVRNNNVAEALLNEAYQEDESGIVAYYVVKDADKNVLFFFSLKCGLLFDEFIEGEKLTRLKELCITVEKKLNGGNVPKEDTLPRESLLSHVVTNLLKNAVEAFREKEREDKQECRSADLQSAASKKAFIRLQAYANAQESIIIDVSNNAGLIPEDVASHIFIPFFTTKPEGSGIGLSLSRQIMRVSGGSLSLHQDKAQGITTFRIIIP